MKTHLKPLKCALVALWLVLLPVVSVFAETVSDKLTPKEILLNSIEAMGGLEAFARIRGSHIERTLYIGDNEIKTIQTTTFPHTMLMEAVSGGQTSFYEYDGMRIREGQDLGTMTQASEGTTNWFRGFYWREWWVVYARYAWHGLGEVYIENLEPITEEGKTFYVLFVSPRDASDYRLFIDAETWLPAKRVFGGSDNEVEDVYSDFAVHDGILFPMRIQSFTGGVLGEDIIYSSVSFTFDEEPLTLERHLNAILEASIDEKRIPGLAAIIDRGGQTIFEKYSGMESIELGLPVKPDSVFPLASVSKTFAGAIAMRLVEQGLLDLNAPIGTYLDFVPDSHRDVATRHLLNHSHGIPDFIEDNPGQGVPLSDEERGTPEGRMTWTLSQPFLFEPGRGWRYSIIGYEILQAVIESATGKDYETLMQDEIFTPLGMTEAKYGGSERIIPGRPSMDYIWLGDTLSYNYLNYDPAHYTAAGLNLTAREVMAFYRALIDGQLLSAELRDEMWREVILETGEGTYYGLGWGSFKTSREGRWSVGHSGGGSSWTRYFPDNDLTVVVLSNLNGAREDSLVYDLATAVEQDARLIAD